MSHGSDDSDNYWPGYVDALTSMVQVLAFVMMMLAMAVFVLSQSVSKKAVEAIAACGLPVRIYGLGEREPLGSCSFHAIDERRFVADLAACRCLVSAAGNQLKAIDEVFAAFG